MVARHVELNAFVLPDDHSIFKLFPGKTYSLSSQVLATKHAFLDIRGLDALVGDPTKWSDTELREIIANDRVTRARMVKRNASRNRVRLLKIARG
jgi:hypothetical protein